MLVDNNLKENMVTRTISDPVVCVEHVIRVFTKLADKKNKKDETVIAVNDLSFYVSQSEFVTLVGTSGCGKTTTLRLIAGIIMPNKGKVLIQGKEVVGPRPETAMVFQDFCLMPWRTCLQNTEFSLELRGVEKQERRRQAIQALDLVGLSKWLDYYPHELSGGMQQRVGIARALCVNPQILLMDEPFGALDAITRTQMQAELVNILSKEVPKKTVIFVTHSIDEALLLSDRIIVFNQGRIIEEISPQLSGPRGQIEMLLDHEYVEIKRHLMDLLGNVAGEEK
jgi:NitT/TauT family transport system ATP-binding protein